jgi:citrate lyase beta subunit
MPSDAAGVTLATVPVPVPVAPVAALVAEVTADATEDTTADALEATLEATLEADVSTEDALTEATELAAAEEVLWSAGVLGVADDVPALGTGPEVPPVGGPEGVTEDPALPAAAAYADSV